MRNNALSHEYRCQSTTIFQVCHPGHRYWNALLRCLQVRLWSAYELLLQGCTLRAEEYKSASDWLAGVAKLLLPRRSRQLSLQQTLCGSVKYYSQQWSAMSTEKAREHVRILKWVLLVKIPRIFLDATASLRTASVRQDQGKYLELFCNGFLRYSGSWICFF